jgi:TolB-like protein
VKELGSRLPDIFLSYNRDDQVTARRFADALTAAGFDVWWDSTIRAGDEYDTVTENALKSARAVVVLWSPRSVVSRWVRAEATLAHRNRTLVPVMIEPCERPIMFELTQTADLSHWDGSPKDAAWLGFLTDLRRQIDSRAAGVSNARGTAPTTAPAGDQSTVRDGRARRQWRSMWLSGALIGMAALLVSGALVLWPHGRTADRHMDGSSAIAILPFNVLSPGPELQGFADGLADQLQGVLSANGMQTVSSLDAKGLRGPDRAQEIERLGVHLVVDGTVQRDGASLRAKVRLDDASRGVTVWTAEFSGPIAEPNSLRGQIGAHVIAVMNCAARALRPVGGLSDSEALSLYVRACDYFETEAESGDMQAVYGTLDTFRKTTVKAPDFGPAHSALAKFLAYYTPVLPPDQAPRLRDEAKQEAMRALAIDPKDADAYVALFLLVVPSRSAYVEGERLLTEGVKADPLWPYVNLFLGAALESVGRMKEGMAYVQRAQAANPLSLDVTIVRQLAWAGRAREADAELARMQSLWPHTAQMWNEALEVHAQQNQWKEYDATLDDRIAWPKQYSDADIHVLRQFAEAARTHSPAAIQAARAALADPRSALPTTLRISYLAQLDLTDDAFAVANAAPTRQLSRRSIFLFTPGTRPMRHDIRFMGLAARLGLVYYWRTMQKWPDFCAEADLPYDCKMEAAKVDSP